MRSSWPSVFSLSNSFQFVLPGPGLFLPGWPLVGAMLWPVFCIYTSWQLFASDQRSAAGQWTETRSSSWYWSYWYPPLLPLFSVTPWPDPWYGNKQCYCWYVVWMGISLWLWCMTSSSWSAINHISTFIISLISFCLLASSFQILVSLSSDCEYLDWEASKFCLGKQFSDVEH